jgi:hypothetical protein
MTNEEYKAALERRLEGFRLLNEWEEANPRQLAPDAALACLNNLYNLIPPELRHREPNEADYLSLRRGLAMIDLLTRESRSS